MSFNTAAMATVEGASQLLPSPGASRGAIQRRLKRARLDDEELQEYRDDVRMASLVDIANGTIKRRRLADDSSSVYGSEETGSQGTVRRKVRRSFGGNRREQDHLVILKERYKHIHVSLDQPKWRTVREEVRFGDVSPVWEAFVADHPDYVPEWFKHTDYTMFSSNASAQMKHLLHFDRKPREDFTAHNDAFDLAFAYVEELLKPDELLEFPVLTDLAHVPFKPEKFGGHEYRLQGFMTRAQANVAAQVDAEAAFIRLLDGERVEPHHVRLGGRGKVKKGSQEYHREMETVAGRLILMLSQRELKLLGVTEKMATFVSKDWECPIWVGKGWFYGGPMKFYEKLKGYTKFYCFDAEKYDASLDPYLIRKAIAIVRSWFIDGDSAQYDAYWDFVLETLITAPIVRDDGFVFRKLVGTTSGHSHNTLMQSILTLAIGYGVVLAGNPGLDPHVVVENCIVFALGDDNLIALREPLNLAPCEYYAEILRDATGISWLGDKSFATTRIFDDADEEEENEQGGSFQGIQFLGKYFKVETVETGGVEQKLLIPYRPAWESIIKLAVPEREPSEAVLKIMSEEQYYYQRVLGVLLDGYGNLETRILANKVLDWLEAKGVSSYLTGGGRDMLELDGWVEEDDACELSVPRISYEDWIAMVHGDRTEVRKALKEQRKAREESA